MDSVDDSLSSLASLLAAVARTPAVPPLVPGAEVGGRYQISGVIGAGGMGVVYRARDRQLQRDVALKLCSRVAESDAGRLFGEAIAMARLSHPNAITVHEAGHEGDDLFLVMELVAGPTLRGWLAAARPSWREVVRMYLEAAAGLFAVHQAGLVHGDFKPENVLLGEDGRVRLVDFGLARVGGDEDPGPGKRPGGTPRYMAPELSQGWYASQRSDQYAFCVALAEALAASAGPGRRPRGIMRLLARGMNADPLMRHDSMATLRRALARELGARRRTAVTAIAALVPVLLGVAIWWVLARAEATRAREDAIRRAALELDVEEGRRELAAGDPGGALVYLSAALDGGLDRPAVRFLLARGLAAFEQSFVDLPAAPATAVAFVRLGPRALVGDEEGALRLYDAIDGRVVRTFEGHTSRIATVALDPAERRVLSASHDGTARVWDLETGTPLATLAGHGTPVAGARFLSDGRVLTWGADGTARAWDPATGRELARFDHGQAVLAALVSRDGAHLYTASRSGQLRAWSLETGALLHDFRAHGDITAVDLDPDLERLATGGTDGVVRLWESDGKPAGELRHPAWIVDVRTTGHGRLITVAQDGVARFWDGRQIEVQSIPKVTRLIVPAAGPRLASIGDDGAIRVWDAVTGRAIATLEGMSAPSAIALDDDGALLLAGGRGGARIWSVARGQFIGSLGARDERFHGAWFGGRDTVIAVDAGGPAIYEPSGAGWKRAGRLRAPAADLAAVNSDGTRYATAIDGALELWPLDSFEPVLWIGTVARVDVLQFSSDGHTLVAAGDGRAAVWDVEHRVRRAAPALGALSRVLDAALAPNGSRLALALEDGEVALWRDDAPTRLRSPTLPARSLAFDRTGGTLAIGEDGGIVLRDLGADGTLKPAARRMQHTLGTGGSPARAIRWSRDGALLFTLGADRSVHVFDTETGVELASIPVDAGADLQLSPDGSRLLVRDELGGVSFWDVSRDSHNARAIAERIRCLVPLALDEENRLVERAVSACP